MRRKALVGVVAAAALPLLTTASFGQAPAPAPAAKPAPPPATTVDPRWRVQPTPQATPQPTPVPPQTTPRLTRRYTQFDELLKPREWPRDDPVNRMPEMPGERLDDQFGLESPPTYESPRPNDPLGPD